MKKKKEKRERERERDDIEMLEETYERFQASAVATTR
jgi:hypothetical protein